MEIVSIVFLVIGLIIGLIYGIQLIIIAFKESILWGLGYLFVPFVSLIFVFMHWDKSKAPFLKILVSFIFVVIGVALAPDMAEV